MGSEAYISSNELMYAGVSGCKDVPIDLVTDRNGNQAASDG